MTIPRHAVLAAFVLGFGGCGSVPPEIWSKAKPEPIPEIPVHVVGMDAGTTLPLATRLWGDTQPIELAAFEVPAEERAKFEKERSEWVRKQGWDSTRGAEKFAQLCVIPPFLPTCAVGLGLAGVTGLMAYSVGAGVASVSSSGPQMISVKEGAAVAQFFRQEVTGFALAERIGRLHESRRTDAEYPQLVVRMKSARLISYGVALRVSMTASAQALRSRDDQTSPTEHTADFIIERDRERLVNSVDDALSILARNISATYFPDGREAIWARVRDTRDPEELRRYVARDPAGPYAKEATVRVALLYSQHCAQMFPSVASPFDLLSGARLPSEGDTFTYRYTNPNVSEPAMHTYRVKSATRQYVVEEYKTSNWCTRDWHHTGGAYIADMGVPMFSPYLGITTDLRPTQADWQLPAHTCVNANCTSRIQVLGAEVVEVPAGRFEATKVQVDVRVSRGPLVQTRTLLVWYVPAVRRAVKFTSTGSETFDLELVSYQVR